MGRRWKDKSKQPNIEDLLSGLPVPELPPGYCWRIGKPNWAELGDYRVEIHRKLRWGRTYKVDHALTTTVPYMVKLAAEGARRRVAIRHEW